MQVSRNIVKFRHRNYILCFVLNFEIQDVFIRFSIFIDNCKGFIAVMWRSLSQKNDQFERLLSSFEDLMNENTHSNPLFYLILGDFNVRFPSWWDEYKISIEGIRLDAFSSYDGLHQVIKKPTHLIETSSLCIDLTFTNQTNLLIDSGVHLSFHNNYHHQIISCKLNLNIKFSSIIQIFSLGLQQN